MVWSSVVISALKEIAMTFLLLAWELDAQDKKFIME